MSLRNSFLAVLVQLSALRGVVAYPAPRQSLCTTDGIPIPELFGAEILNLTASEYRSQAVAPDEDDVFPKTLTVSFCGVNISYTHPGWSEIVNVEIWLPLAENWNGRFQGVGGGGWVTGDGAPALAKAVSDGYSAASTDGGHANENASPSNWALDSPGNLNYPLLQDFAATALADMTLLGQAVTEVFYGRKPEYSYWTGCSTGGRQGLMMAQRYPELYDGIIATAPAINWDSFIVAEYWAQHVMDQLGVYPPPCELRAYTEAAVAACDTLDALGDGVISDPSACKFDPHSVVGESFSCGTQGEMKLTEVGAIVAAAAWTGPVDPSGTQQWYGLSKDAALNGLVNTSRPDNGSESFGLPFQISTDWIRYFVAKDPNFDVTNVTNEEYFRVLHRSRNEFASIIGTHDPDLSPFKARNGKIITWHGSADQLIFPQGTERYYSEVLEQVSDVRSFYRYFQAPGVAHCRGGVGRQPVGELEALVKWVEHDVAPDTLPTLNQSLYGKAPGQGEKLPEGKICAWPKEQKYKGGDPLVAESFDCI